ncbi:MAG: thioredoxin family protein [Actinomycetota bacterium]|nr:thioredoxin family protein [Actinomycetota bacterium]
MELRLLYFDGCPNWRVARENLRAALAGLGWAQSFEAVLAETEDQARALHFTGSPTIVLDGKDIFDSGNAPAALACRLYRTGTGLAGSPTTEDIVTALQREAGSLR